MGVDINHRAIFCASPPERRNLENAGGKSGFVTFVSSRFTAAVGPKTAGIIRAVPGADGTSSAWGLDYSPESP